MKKLYTVLLVGIALFFGRGGSLAAQNLPADSFLEHVSEHPVGDEVERDAYLKTGNALDVASPAEVQRVLPSILEHVRSGNDVHVRVYASGLLLGIAQRADGADLLSPKATEISAILADRDPAIQRTALAITDYVIGKSRTNNGPYITALTEAVQQSRIPQDIRVGMAAPLLSYGSGDTSAVKAVLNFLNRDDLTVSTRTALINSLASGPDLPEEVAQALTTFLNDPDPRVRAAAVIAFADSTSTFHRLAQDRVEKMANDPKENSQVRELAKGAMAGKTSLNPNIDVVPAIQNPR